MNNNQIIKDKKIAAILEELRNIKVNIAESFEFYYIVQGKANLNCMDKFSRLEAGDIFMAIPGQAYMLIPDHEPSLYINLTVDHSYIRNYKDFEDKYLPCITKSKDIREAQLNILYRIYEEIYQENYDQVDELIQIFLEKLPWVDNVDYEELNSQKKVDLIGRAALVFEEREPGLEDLAQELDISPSYLSRVFKEVTGIRFSDYSQRKKLEKATRLLLTDLNIEEISTEVGFTSSKSLNRIFRQFVNTTPSNYRKFVIRLATKKTKQKDLRYKCGFQEFANKYAEPSYANTMTEYLGSNYNKHRLSVNTQSIVEPALDFHAIGLDNFGKNYLQEINRVLNSGENKLLVIQIKIKEDDLSQIYYSDLDIWVPTEELYKLLKLLEEKESWPLLSVEILDKSIEEFCNQHQREELTNYIHILEGFYRQLILNVGRNLVENCYHSFDTSSILELTSQKAITYFFEFLEKRHLMMEKIFYTGNYKSLYNIGFHDVENLDKIIDFISKNRHRIRLPHSAYTSLRIPQVVQLKEPHQLLSALKSYGKLIQELNKLGEDSRLKNTNVKVQGVEMKLDLDFVDPLYFDLFFSILSLDLWMNLKTKSRIIPGYRFLFQCRTKSSIFESKLINQDGFPTTYYHISSFIAQIPSEVIYHKEGCLVSKSGEDIHVLVYTNPLLDYSFSLERGFEHLNDYKRELEITIDGMEGSYKETTQIISRYRGSPYYFIKDFSKPELMNEKEINYVKSQSIPKLMVDYLEIEDSHEINIKMTPFEVIYKVFTKIENPS